jgi:hypothetical protein
VEDYRGKRLLRFASPEGINFEESKVTIAEIFDHLWMDERTFDLIAHIVESVVPLPQELSNERSISPLDTISVFEMHFHVRTTHPS